MLNQDTVREATRLTRAGRLVEATALLQGMLRGDSAPSQTSRSAAQAPLARLEPPTIDAEAYVVEERETLQTSQARPQGRKRASPRDGMRQLYGLGLRGPITRAPPSTSDIVSCPRAHGSSRVPSATKREATSCSSQAALRDNSFR
jgi:hypothetical protein